MEKEKLIPRLRFPQFTDAWEQRKFSDVVEIGSGMDYKHLGEGDIPVYGTGGYMLSVDAALSENKDAIGIGRKGTIDKPYILRAPFWTVDTLFYCIPKEKNDLDFTNCLFQNVDWKKKDESTGVPSLSKVIINNVETSVPSYDEQKRIGELFNCIDNLITLRQHRLDYVKSFKSGMLQKMFPKNGESVPEFRFPGFADAWEQRKFNDISEKLCVGFVGTCEKYYTDKALGIPMYRTGNIKDGFLVEDDMKYVTRDFHEKNKKSHLMKNDILIARFGENGLGARYLKDEEANCLNCIILRSNVQANAEYVKQYLSSDTFRKKAFSNTVGSTFSILNTTTLGKMDIPFTSLPEQETIAKFLSTLDNLITLHQRKLKLLEEYKRGLLQKMFV